MAGEVLLDAAVVNRCRRRVHLDHDPAAGEVPHPLPDPAAEQRMADAAAHRADVAARMWLSAPAGPLGWVEIAEDLPAAEREQATLAAMASRVGYIWNPQLPTDTAGGRRGRVQLLVAHASGYLPVLVVRHRITDAGAGALTSAPFPPRPTAAAADAARKARPHGGDQMRLAHAVRMLRAAGHASTSPLAGVVGLDADVVVWHDLTAGTWPGGRSALDEYDHRFADRVAVATAALRGAPALAEPSRVVECRRCPWWPRCEAELIQADDVSLVLRGEDAVALRAEGVRTVQQLAALDRAGPPPVALVGSTFGDAVALARAWLAGLTVARRVHRVRVPRADVEVDVDMESFSDSGAYLWGCLLSGAEVGIPHGYRAFATWDPLPSADEARSFAEFWQWLTTVRARAAARGLSFRAYCYNELAENRWLLGSAERFAGQPGVPTMRQVHAFIGSPAWVDLYQSVAAQLLCARGKGLKVIAPVAGFHWRDQDASGENSMRWYRDAVGLDGAEPNESQRHRLLTYNEDDVRATHALRTWLTGPASDHLTHIDAL